MQCIAEVENPLGPVQLSLRCMVSIYCLALLSNSLEVPQDMDNLTCVKRQSGIRDSFNLGLSNLIMGLGQLYLRLKASSMRSPAANASYAAPPSYNRLLVGLSSFRFVNL